MLENYARRKSMASLAEQLSVKCDVVWIREDEELRQKPLADVTPEDVIVVRSGSVIPVDGVVLDGEAAVNQTAMTGEPLAVHRTTAAPSLPAPSSRAARSAFVRRASATARASRRSSASSRKARR